MAHKVGGTPVHPGRRRCIIAAMGAVFAVCLPVRATERTNVPALMLANVYHPGVDLGAYWVSEKYDGVRGFWTGTQLLTRGGNPVHAPTWFTKDWPNTAMDGELWAGRGGFDLAVGTVRSDTPNDAAWRGMRFMVFDLPGHPGSFNERIPAMQRAVSAIGQTWVVAVKQERVASTAELQASLAAVVRQGGEGLMLHRGDSLYAGTRSDDLLKLKLHEDAEARVVAHLPGKGKYKGLLGALLVQTPEGQSFRLGSGLSDAVRHAPPPIGSWVTYRFRGQHASGLPRFASFLRLRADAAENGLPTETPPVGQR